MHPTEVLSGEHRVILRVLECLERMVDAGARSGVLNVEDAGQALEFMRTFADDCHHAKEEDLLFPRLVERGLPHPGGPVEVMLQEHDLGRAHVRAMREQLPAAGAGDASALQAFAREAHGFVDLLRQHIHKEDHILFPMAGSFLNAQDVGALREGFEAAEARHAPGTHQRMLGLANELAERYGVEESPATAAPAGGPGCCHGTC